MDSDTAPQTTEFCLNLLQQLYKPDENLVVSPYSLVSALIMLVLGAGGNSQLQLIMTLFDKQVTAISAEASKHVSAFTSTNKRILGENNKTLASGNFLYSGKDFPLNSEYVAKLSSDLAAIAKTLDFSGANAAAVASINADVEATTHGMIRNLINSLSPATRLVLVNAIYFKGAWEHPFKKDQTEEAATFHLSSGSTVQVPMMHQDRSWSYFENFEEGSPAKGSKAVLLDYNNGNIAMLLILPAEGVKLSTFISSHLSADYLKTILMNSYSQGKVLLSVPRFKLTGNHQLASSLQKMGLSEVFSAGVANLSGISPRYAELSLSEVIQQAVIEVNEEGTTAAAGTALLLLGSSRFPPKPKEFKADRPFIYALVTKDTRQLLFIGAVEDPSKAK